MRIVDINTDSSQRFKAAKRTLTSALLDKFKQDAEHLIGYKQIDADELLVCICEAINDVQMTLHEDTSEEWANLQYAHSIIECATYALDIDPRLSPDSARLRALQSMQTKIQDIKNDYTKTNRNTA